MAQALHQLDQHDQVGSANAEAYKHVTIAARRKSLALNKSCQEHPEKRPENKQEKGLSLV